MSEPGTKRRVLDPESVGWLDALAATGHRHDEAAARLRELLLRAAGFEVRRRRTPLDSAMDLDQLAADAADDALMAILAKLDSYRGDSRFTTWAYKFALLEAAVKMRRRAWHGRELPMEENAWSHLQGLDAGPERAFEDRELMTAVRRGIDEALTAQQRLVLLAITVEGVPIDVLAERLDKTRGAVYKTLHDARRKLRAHLAEEGLEPSWSERGAA